MKLGVAATSPAYRDHVTPIWSGLEPEERSWFLVDEERFGVHAPPAPTTWLTASTRDLRRVLREFHAGRLVYMDHGVGLQLLGAAGISQLRRASLILAPNEFTAAHHRASTAIPVEIIGTPKMDRLAQLPRSSSGPTIAVSFHWTSMSRLDPPPTVIFEQAIAELAAREDLTVIGHGHPRAWEQLRPWYLERGIEPVARFEDVVRRADVYACDHSSTIYEWAALGRAAILLDVPATVKRSSGLRYTDHADVGYHATPATLHWVVEHVFANGPPPEAGNVSIELFPYLGCATSRAIDVLRNHDAS